MVANLSNLFLPPSEKIYFLKGKNLQTGEVSILLVQTIFKKGFMKSKQT